MAANSDEFFYRDSDGKRQDAAFHEGILDNRQADLFGRIDSFMSDVGNGDDVGAAMRRYALPPSIFDSPIYQDVTAAREADGESVYKPR